MILFDNSLYSITEDSILREGKTIVSVDQNGALVSYATELFPGKKVSWSPQVLPQGRFPTITCDFPLLQGVIDLALETFLLNCGEQGPWRAGFKYLGWVRDNSFHTIFGGGLLSLQACRKSLLQWATGKRIAFEQFPQMTDSIIWILAAYEHYLQTLDRKFLELIYQKAVPSLEFIIDHAFNRKYKLITGGNIIQDSASAYPPEIYRQGREMTSDTNMLYCRALEITATIENLLGLSKRFDGLREEIKNSVNRYFYQPDGSYHQFLDQQGRPSGTINNLASICAVLWDICDNQQKPIIEAYVKNAINPFGIKFTEPVRDTSHLTGANRTFPLALAARAFRSPQISDLCLAAGLYTTATTLSFREAVDDRGTGWRYFGIMWDALSFLSLIFHSTLGLDFTEKGLRFLPVKSRLNPNYLSLENLSIYGTECNIAFANPGTPVRVNGREISGPISKDALLKTNEIHLGNIPKESLPPKKIMPPKFRLAPPTKWQVTVYPYFKNPQIVQDPARDFNFRSLPYPLHGWEDTFFARDPDEIVQRINSQYPKYLALHIEKSVSVEVEGEYSFTLHVRDGGRLFIDNRSVIDADGIDWWQPAANETTIIREGINQGAIYLHQGVHLFSIDCFVRRGPLELLLSSTPPLPSVQ